MNMSSSRSRKWLYKLLDKKSTASKTIAIIAAATNKQFSYHKNKLKAAAEIPVIPRSW